MTKHDSGQTSNPKGYAGKHRPETGGKVSATDLTAKGNVERTGKVPPASEQR